MSYHKAMEGHCSRRTIHGLIVLALLISTSRVLSQTLFPYIQLQGSILRNNSIVDLSSLNTVDQLRCVTDLNTCCTEQQGSAGGSWILPNGTRLSQSGVQEIRAFLVTAGESSLNLQLSDEGAINNLAVSGVYECSMDTSSGTRQSVYIGLYYQPNAGE